MPTRNGLFSLSANSWSTLGHLYSECHTWFYSMITCVSLAFLSQITNIIQVEAESPMVAVTRPRA